MGSNIENVVLNLLKIVRPMAATHPFWHISHTQEDILRELDGMIQELENPPVEPAPPVDAPSFTKVES